MTSTRHLAAGAAFLSVLAIAGAALPAAARTFDVTTTADGNDGACDAHCTLREAIVAANADRDRDVINLPPGTYRLSIPGRGEDRAATGDLDILERIDLRGSAAATTIIDGAGIDRVLHVHRMEWQHGDEPVRVADVTITGGAVQSREEGGGILVEGALELEHCTVAANSASGHLAAGGGIANAGVLALRHVAVSDNSTEGSAGPGGGIWNRLGTLSLSDSVIADNSTDGDGSHGAGLYTELGTVTMARVTVAGNNGLGTRSDGGGIWAGYSTVLVAACTVSDNTVPGDRGGGGAWIGFSTVDITNSTISGNETTNVGSRGGGLWTDDSTLLLASSTFSGNSAASGQAPSGAIWKGGGTVLVVNTLIDGGCVLDHALESGGGNLESPGDSCGFDRPSDQPGVDPAALGLGDLADNGGPTLTHALMAESAAIDRGLGGLACPPRDQRGEPRPQDGDGDGHAECDVGAFEAAGEPPGGVLYSYWVPVAAHSEGSDGSKWRTTVGALNRSASPAELEIVLRSASDTFTMSASVAANGQGVFDDIGGQLGVVDDKGTLEIRSDRPLLVTSRTFNWSADGTFGQFLAGMTADDGLRSGHTALLPQLVQNQDFRCNLGLATMGGEAATVELRLYDAGGSEVGTASVTVEAGQLRQENEIYRSVAGLDELDGGYATVTVTSGSGVVAYASVIDNRTGDATTIPMSR